MRACPLPLGAALRCLIFVGLFAAATASAAEPAWDDISAVGRFPFGACYCAAAMGDTVVWGQGPTLRITDFSQPGSPRNLGELVFEHSILGVTVVPGRAYVSCLSVGLVILDLSDMTAPSILATYRTAQRVWGMAPFGSYLAIGNASAGVRILDVSDPTRPFQAGSYLVAGGNAKGLCVDGSLLYVSYASKGLHIADISVPTAPVEVGRQEGFIAGWALAKAGDFVYIPRLPQGLSVIDVSTPSAPVPRGYFAGVTSCTSVAYRAGHLWMTSVAEGVQALDVGDPALPALAGVYIGSWPQTVLSGRQWLYVPSGGDGLVALDVAQPAQPQEVGRVDDCGYTFGVTVGGGHAYMTTEYDGLRIIDVADPAHPRLAAHVPAYIGYDAAWRDGFVYVAATDAGGLVVDVHDPASPQTVAVLPGYWVVGVALDGSRAYLADNSQGLRIFDVADPAHPVALGAANVGGESKDVAVRDGYAYLANGNLGLRVIDVRDPLAPVAGAAIPTRGFCGNVEVVDRLAVLVEGTAGVELADLTNPAAPMVISALTLGNSAIRGAAVLGQRLYLADELSGLWVYDLTDPTRPLLCDQSDPLLGAQRVTVGAGLLWVTGLEDGLWVLRDGAATAVTLSGFRAERAGRVVQLSWTFGGADLPARLHVYRQAPGAPRARVTTTPLPAAREGAFTDTDPPAGPTQYWLQTPGPDGADRWLGPASVTAAPPSPLALHAATPNPFNPQTTVRFSLPTAMPVRLAVYDQRGHLVRSLLEAPCPAGEQSVAWDGRDGRGQAAASGIYMVRLVTGQGARTIKVTLAR